MVERANRRLIFTLLAGAAVWVPQAAAAEAEQQPAPQSADKDSPKVEQSGNLGNADLRHGAALEHQPGGRRRRL